MARPSVSQLGQFATWSMSWRSQSENQCETEDRHRSYLTKFLPGRHNLQWK